MIVVREISVIGPLGSGRPGWSLGEVGEPSRLSVRPDPVLARVGLRRPFSARLRDDYRQAALSGSTSGAAVIAAEDPATTLLIDCFTGLSALRSVARGARVGLAVGTSSGAMASSERLFQALSLGQAVDRHDYAAATYFAPFQALVAEVARRGLDVLRTAHPVTACSASTLAIGLGTRWLKAHVCDVVIAGGYDVLTTFVAAGFEALRATTGSPPPRPFRRDRDGMCLGEAAALWVLTRSDFDMEAPMLGQVAGFGASGDAVHLTAPDRTGRGLAVAARSALTEAAGAASPAGQVDVGGPDRESSDRGGPNGAGRTGAAAAVDLVSVHGTATPFNDLMEGKALREVFGADVDRVPVHAAKAAIGHTLGAAGAMESSLCVDALVRGILPATAGEGPLDPEVGLVPLDRNQASPVSSILKLSAAFGGANAALVLRRVTEVGCRPEPVAPVRVRTSAEVVVSDGDPTLKDPEAFQRLTGVSTDRMGRLDDGCRMALIAVGRLAQEVGPAVLRGAGIVCGTVLATVDVNAVYYANLLRRGAAAAEGRRFAYTTPNAAAAECAMAFVLTGPNIAVCRGLDADLEAREVADDLLCGRDAAKVVVLAVEPPGPVATVMAPLLGVSSFRARAHLRFIDHEPDGAPKKAVG